MTGKFVEVIVDGKARYVPDPETYDPSEDVVEEVESPISFTPEEIAAQEAWDEQARINRVSLRYLADTDWYVTRFQETGQAIPEDVATKRQEARDSIVHQ